MMSEMAVEILTGSRMHFGLICGTELTGWKFGGFGLMVQAPGWHIQLNTIIPTASQSHPARDGQEPAVTSPPSVLQSEEPLRPAELGSAGTRIRIADRRVLKPSGQHDGVGESALLQRVQAAWNDVTSLLEWSAADRMRLNRTQLQIIQAPPLHSGFGAGTQLTLALASGAEVLCGPGRSESAARMAECLGRGSRSAVGTAGFERGGLVVDFGESSAEPGKRKLQRLDVPEQWQFVLVCPRSSTGLSGDSENAFFARRQTMDVLVVQQLSHVLLDQVVPAVQSANFALFARGMEAYGQIAGQFYAPTQGDVFSHPRMNQLAEWLGQQQVFGAAQSSWGPGICIPAENPLRAHRICDLVRQFVDGTETAVSITSALNRGATIRTTAPEVESSRFA